jgi:Kef-type K+ transport system membrane component KefB
MRCLQITLTTSLITGAGLLLVIGIALLMTLVDLSPALGTFFAGVLLADIESFNGLLLDQGPRAETPP